MVRLRKLEKKIAVGFLILALRNTMQEYDRLEDLSYTVRHCSKRWGWGGVGEIGEMERDELLLLPCFKE